MQKWIASCLLVLFALVTVPKEWLHHCAHEHSAVEHGHDALSKDDTCEFCDVTVVSVYTLDDQKQGISATYQTVRFDLSPVFVPSLEPLLLQGRAPPVLA